MRRLALALAALAATTAAVAVRLEPPAPRAASRTEFSAERAWRVVEELGAGGEPRPVGSAADRRAVEVVAARFRALGYRVEVQEAFACGVYGVCATARNLLARPPASGAGAVLLAAHHDSVGAGPGAADDLSGVAVLLEVARALRAGPSTRRPVAFLVDDAEEMGLVGAAAFLDRHPFAREVAAVVNVEARGTGGPSLMFETTGDGPWLGPALRRLPRPVTGSLFGVVYERLPNDTDLSVFRRRHLPGLNFAFTRGVTRYHTPRDDLAHLSAASLQHQGEHALAAARALADAEDLAPGRRLAFADLLALGVVSYPARAEALLALAALAGAMGAAARLRRAGAVRLGPVALGTAAALASPAAAALAGWLLRVALGAALPRPFVAHPAPFSAAAACAGLAAAGAAGALFGPARARALQAGSAAATAALAVVAGVAFPGAAPPLVLPALATSAALVISARGGAGPARAHLGVALVAVIANGLLLGPVAWLLTDLLGAMAAPAIAALAALAAMPVAPLLAALLPRARWACAAAPLAAMAAAAAVAATRAHATFDDPQRMTIAYHEDAAGARWLVESEAGPLPPALRRAAAFGGERQPAFPWSPLRRAFAAPAAPAGLPPPRLSVLETAPAAGGRRVRARLASARGAGSVLLLLAPGAEVAAARMEGVEIPPPAPRARRYYGGRVVYGCTTVPPGGVELELTLRGAAPVEAVVLDVAPGLPPGGAALQAARPPDAVPSQEGDVSVVSARATL